MILVTGITGKVAAAALTEKGHEGKLYDITGPEALTNAEMASHVSDALDKPVSFGEVSESDMPDTLVRLGTPAWQADGLIEKYAITGSAKHWAFPLR